MVKDSVLNTIERNKTMPANLHLDRAMGKPKEDAPQYSDFNLNRQKHVEQSRKENDAQLRERTGLDRLEVGQDRRAIAADHDVSTQKLQEGIRDKTVAEMDRRFKVIQSELEENPVERKQNTPASMNSALVSKGNTPDPSRAMLTADNLTVSEAIQRYNAKREAKDKE